jgi:cephalosporin hydroxylase
MITIIDETAEEIIVRDGVSEQRFPMASSDGFRAASRAWLRASWDVKYIYSFTWFGRPIIQLPEDMLRIQEVIFTLKPDVIIETGVAHGGSLVFYASLFEMMGKGRVIGIDVEIRPHNRVAIDAHPMRKRIETVEGSSIDPAIVERVRAMVQPGETVLVVLDSNHSRDHVLAELKAYGPMVTAGSYIVAMDGIMALVAGGPRTKADWGWNNPTEAAKLFVESDHNFQIEEPAWLFNEGMVTERVTYWPGAFVKKLR